MAQVVGYHEVLDKLTRAGLECLYHNSGAFGFGDGTATHSVGWILREDATIRASARELAVIVPGDESTLAARAVKVWKSVASNSPAWILPKSHWAYELDFGSPVWLAAALTDIGIDAHALAGQNNGSAIAFTPDERTACQKLIEQLLTHLAGSDFALVLGGGAVLCTIHHHKQLWWTTRDANVATTLRHVP